MMTTTATKERLVPVSVKPDVEAIRVLEQRLPGCRGNLKAEYVEGLLILTGHVPTYYSKQVAQESVREVEHVLQIENRLEVVRAK